MYVFNTGCPSIDLIKKEIKFKKIFSKNKELEIKLMKKKILF